MDECPICKKQMSYQGIKDRDDYAVTCPRCGEYRITKEALAELRSIQLVNREIADIVGWLSQNKFYEITTANLHQLLSIKAPSFLERADLLLLTFEKQTTYAGEFISRESSWVKNSWCVNIAELDEIINYLEECNRIKQSNEMGTHALKICPNGWAHLEEIKRINPESQQCFVAMWFDASMENIYEEAIAPAISSAGYLSHRVDQREHNEKIDDEIIAQIKKSRFILADFTGHRGGVYYEAGFAKGLGLEVIWTCREDDAENLHFDIRQFNCILWNNDDLDRFKKKIKNRIEAVIGEGKK